MQLSDVKCFLLDMDGTFYLGGNLIPGSLEFIQRVVESGRDYLFLTNNSSHDSAFYVKKLAGMGLTVTGEQIRVILVTALSFLISVTNAYYWNNRYVFGQGKKTAGEHIRAYLKTAACYALTGLILAPAAKVWLVGVGVPFWIASLSTLIITIPLNFILNKFWAFAKRK